MKTDPNEFNSIRMPVSVKKLKEFKYMVLEKFYKTPQIVYDEMLDLVVEFELLDSKTNPKRRELNMKLRDILKKQLKFNAKPL